MALAALIGAIGQLLMKHAAGLMSGGEKTLVSGGIMLLAFFLYGLVMLLFLKGLKYGREISTTYPVYSLTFPFAAVLAWFIYGEVMHEWQWVGMLLICLGVGVMNKVDTPDDTSRESAK